MATEIDVVLPDGRTLHAYDTGSGSLPVFWLHGTPNIGAPPRPLFGLSEPLGIRWLGYDRPWYGGSTPRPGRDIASAAADVGAVADALGVDSFAVVGHSGGAPHALACAALMPDRVRAAVAVSGYVPYGTPGVDWFAGMSEAAAASLRAAIAGREAKERYEATAEADDDGFTEADLDALAGDWSWFLEVVRPALANGPGPLIDDDLAMVGPWGFDVTAVGVPVLLLHGGADRMAPVAHAAWLADHCPTASLRVSPADGHISVLRSAGPALDWLAARSD
ncbi:MAG TPA: alpha/beta hydrolase [Mycobacteriales bacterium]|nr:alpha/beta hydrolase [Mycobacteriales bacterium]